MWYFCAILFLALVVPAGAQAEETPTATAAEPALVSIDEPPTFTFPQRREMEGYSLVLHAPQIDSETYLLDLHKRKAPLRALFLEFSRA